MHVKLKSNLFYITSVVWAFISLPYSSQHSATEVRTHISVFTERTNRRIKALVICFHSHANHAVGSFFSWELSVAVMPGWEPRRLWWKLCWLNEALTSPHFKCLIRGYQIPHWWHQVMPLVGLEAAKRQQAQKSNTCPRWQVWRMNRDTPNCNTSAAT